MKNQVIIEADVLYAIHSRMTKGIGRLASPVAMVELKNKKGRVFITKEELIRLCAKLWIEYSQEDPSSTKVLISKENTDKNKMWVVIDDKRTAVEAFYFSRGFDAEIIEKGNMECECDNSITDEQGNVLNVCPLCKRAAELKRELVSEKSAERDSCTCGYRGDDYLICPKCYAKRNPEPEEKS